MEISGWIMFAIVFWGFGYIKSKFGEPLDGRFVHISKWVYVFLCGLPQSKDAPEGFISVIGLRAQVFGWLLVIYGIFLRNAIANELLSFVVGFTGSLIISYFFAEFLISKEE